MTPQGAAGRAVPTRIAQLPRPSHGVLRPIQYLGNKLRSLDALTRAAVELAPAGRCLDLFSGTSVVAQGLARTGMTITAVDALSFAANFATAFLGIGRCSADGAASVPVEKVLAALPARLARNPFASWIDRERAALERGDGAALIELSRRVPQVWRESGARGGIAAALARVGAMPGKEPAVPVLMSTHYAGTYFGIGQAAALDALRSEVARLDRAGALSSWQRSVLLAAICAAASDAAFSPGKHFAQPHRLGEGKTRDAVAFLVRRIVQDRSVDVGGTFAARAHQIAEVAAEAGHGHRALATTFERIVAAPGTLGSLELIYADPPYTAQQYSRFYHVLEVLFEYRLPELQRVGGRVTSGLYPANRHLSRFCSKRQARGAFEDLVALADETGADLLLSYSASRSGASGNDRMISLPELLEVCRARVGASRVDVRVLNHTYRQFNHQSLAVARREDPEYLIVRRNRC